VIPVGDLQIPGCKSEERSNSERVGLHTEDCAGDPIPRDAERKHENEPADGYPLGRQGYPDSGGGCSRTDATDDGGEDGIPSGGVPARPGGQFGERAWQELCAHPKRECRESEDSCFGGVMTRIRGFDALRDERNQPMKREVPGSDESEYVAFERRHDLAKVATHDDEGKEESEPAYG